MKHVWLFIFFLMYHDGINASLYKDYVTPEVTTPLGKVRGSWKSSYDGRPYAAFEGIPYAKPPIGSLRFGEPQPVEPWSGTLEATQLYECTQTSLDQKSDVKGEEDCLYMNVFVPLFTHHMKKLAVVIHIHGGGFIEGSGIAYIDPRYIMDRDVVLATFNYRLGALGFLSTGDDVVSGNNGLKDQALALKWVKENIEYFGGNSNSITLTGFSAGAASVHLHYLSPLSKNLFHRGMSVSGVATAPWVIDDNPLNRTQRLAHYVGCPNHNTTEMVDCLKTRPANLLIKKSASIVGFGTTTAVNFKPVVEKKQINTFLSEYPYKLLDEGKVLDVPWISSITADDGIVLVSLYLQELEEIDRKWTEAAPHILELNRSLSEPQRSTIPKKIRDFYFTKEGTFKENIKQLTKLFTDRYFLTSAEIAVELQAKANKSPVYFYYFNYGKGENSFPRFIHADKSIAGISHGDDMIYLFGGIITIELSENDIKLKNKCLDMLYAYAVTGTPSFKDVNWTPNNGEKLAYLNITGPEDIKLQFTKELSPRTFWKNLLEDSNLFIKKT